MVIVIALVVVLALAGAGAMFFLKKKPAGDEDGEEAVAETSHSTPAADSKNPPTFLPIDNLVVNLADPGGERFAQIGITFQMADAHSSDTLKTSLPKVRSAVLMMTSSRTSQELLTREGKEKLAKSIAAEASRTFGIEPEDEDEEEADTTKKKKKKKRAPVSPVQAVLFSSFIVQ
ncbi:flagellar basal body protein FliL [Xylophilus sp. Kf1]|nr:flagellar basal body protein FliL [Xylophilus sp. Kf1]